MQRLMRWAGFGPLAPAPGSPAQQQESLRHHLTYLGASGNPSLQALLRQQEDVAERRREGTGKFARPRTTLLDGLAVAMPPHKRDSGEPPPRNPWARLRRKLPNRR